jgi:L-cysteine desulfidase
MLEAAEMAQSSSKKRGRIAALLAIVMLSSVTMVWMFWHFPRITAMVTIIVLAGLGISARLSRLIDSDLSELGRRNQSS